MSNALPILFIGGMIAIVASVIAWAVIAAKKRREAWMAEADRLGLAYMRNHNGLSKEYAQFKLFSRGRSRRAPNAMSGHIGNTGVCLADYQYTTGSGKNSRNHVQTVCILTDAQLGAPHCFLRPESRLFDFLGKAFGGQDINYDEDPGFSKAFVLQGGDEVATRAFFTAEVRAHFMQYAKTRINFEVHGDTLVHHKGVRMKPEQLQSLLDEAMTLRDLICRPADPVAESGVAGWSFSD